MQRGLWLVALVFAGFLVGLGGTVVRDLPQVDEQPELEQYIDVQAATPVRAAIAAAETAYQRAQTELEQAGLKRDAARENASTARDAFKSWLATRQVTQLPDQDSELIARNRALDVLGEQERDAGRAVEAQQQASLDAEQTVERETGRLTVLESAAQELLDVEYRRLELRVFLYRLALTLPLLVVAGWLFAKKRKTTYWPFVWGFIIFAVFAFFVELVPYLPSYGGYVRYAVGIVVTVLVGRQAIVALNRYLEKQKLAEALPDAERRVDLSYDTALARLTKSVCPGCERPVDLKNPEIDFCPHCGICLFDHCLACTTRKSAFAKFCHACGTVGSGGTREEAAAKRTRTGRGALAGDEVVAAHGTPLYPTGSGQTPPDVPPRM